MIDMRVKVSDYATEVRERNDIWSGIDTIRVYKFRKNPHSC